MGFSLLEKPICVTRLETHSFSQPRMNTLTFSSPFPTESASSRHVAAGSPYASVTQTATLLRSGAQHRRDRMDAADMMTTDEAAALAGTTRVTVNAWIKSGRCIGVSNLRRGFKLPRWQFEPTVWPALQPMAKSLGSSDGWQLLSFLESPSSALDGQTPRAALEQGIPIERILALATAEAH